MTCTLMDSDGGSKTLAEQKQEDIGVEVLILKKMVCGKIVAETLYNILDHLPKPNGKFCHICFVIIKFTLEISSELYCVFCWKN